MHANAALTPIARLRLGTLIVDDGWPVARAAERFQVSWPTAKRWADRYRESGCETGVAAMADRSSRSHHSPLATPAPVRRKVVHLRWKQRLGPVGSPRSSACRPPRCTASWCPAGSTGSPHVDRATGEPVRRYEHPHPGDLVHVDVKKLGNIPDGGGWRYVGRAQGLRNRAVTPGKPRNRHHNPKMGTGYLHTVLDDHSRVAYTEMCDDETAATAVAVLRRAGAWFAACGIVIRAVLSDNDPAIARTCGATPAPNWASNPAGRGLIGRRPTGRWNGSTAP